MVITTVFFLGFVACQNQTSEPNPSEKESFNLKSGAVPNPYNYVGVFHNDALLNYANHIDFPQISTKDLLTDANSLYVTQNLPNATLLSSQQTDLLSAELDKYTPTIDGLKITANDLYAKGKISVKVRDAMLQVNTIFNDSVTIDNQADLATAFDYVIGQLSVIEQSFINRTDFNTQEREQVLTTISIAKHSVAFWKDAELNPNNPYYVSTNKFLGKIWKRIRNAVIVAAADAVGGLIGGSIGSGAVSVISAAIVSAAASEIARVVIDALAKPYKV